jgi:hypothetical protein
MFCVKKLLHLMVLCGGIKLVMCSWIGWTIPSRFEKGSQLHYFLSV